MRYFWGVQLQTHLLHYHQGCTKWQIWSTFCAVKGKNIWTTIACNSLTVRFLFHRYLSQTPVDLGSSERIMHPHWAVIRWLVAGFPPRSGHGICGGQSGTRAGFLQVLRYPLPILIPPNAPYSSFEAGTMGQLVADVPSGLSLTAPDETN
jgi:hypothetical protein